jgi:hypothetical protein
MIGTRPRPVLATAGGDHLAAPRGAPLALLDRFGEVGHGIGHLLPRGLELLACAILEPPMCPAVTYTETDNRRESWTAGGWNLSDDDVPRPPELSPLDSAQARRAVKQSTPAGGPQPKLN